MTSKRVYKTSWDDESLKQLCDKNNHRINYDGYQYIWQHKLNGKWEIHSIFKYDDYNKPYADLMFWLHCWNKDLIERTIKDYKRSIRKQAKTMKFIHEIATDHVLKTKNKALKIHELAPELTQQEIADMLNVNRVSINRYLNE